MEVSDLRPEWLKVARHLQSKCHDNNGYALLNITVVVKENAPLMWTIPEVRKISPMSLANIEISPTVVALLAQMAVSEASVQVDSNEDREVE
jgi:hypothetical protein